MTDKILNMIGLAKKAGRLADGSYRAEESIKNYKAFLVIVANDASENTKKHFSDMCSCRDIPVCFYSDMDNLGRYTGRDSCAAAAVLDEGFAERLKAMIREVVV